MGLFDKKYCDFCGSKIGLLGNRKLEDGNMCKDCASKLSPWFSERRHSTKAEISEQLAYREDNKKAAAAFHTTRSLGKNVKLLLDEDAHKFMVTSARDLTQANPDVFDYDQATGCSLDIRESRNELKRKDADGKSVSYNPPRYEYSYNLYATIHVNHPYVDDMEFSVSNGYIKTGEQRMNGATGGWNVHTSGLSANSMRMNEYYDCMNLGNEIKQAVDRMHQIARGEAPTAAAPAPAAPSAPAAASSAAPSAAFSPAAGPVTFPFCGATTTPDAKGCCEYCGSKL